jgi:hypothetical protein
MCNKYRVIHERGISEYLFAATHYTHCNNILISGRRFIQQQQIVGDLTAAIKNAWKQYHMI